jgi:hypothetical protein
MGVVMKVRWQQMFPGQILNATLTTVPSQVSRTEQQVVLEIAGPAPMALYPGSASGVEVVEATPEEREALRRAGFDLGGASTQEPKAAPAKRPWWKFWG